MKKMQELIKKYNLRSVDFETVCESSPNMLDDAQGYLCTLWTYDKISKKTEFLGNWNSIMESALESAIVELRKHL